MAGRENWRGSGFHADVVTERVLAGLIAKRNAERGGTAPPDLPVYWIEHAAGDNGPDWDVEHRGKMRILEELKSGKIAERAACEAGSPGRGHLPSRSAPAQHAAIDGWNLCSGEQSPMDSEGARIPAFGVLAYPPRTQAGPQTLSREGTVK